MTAIYCMRDYRHCMCDYCCCCMHNCYCCMCNCCRCCMHDCMLDCCCCMHDWCCCCMRDCYHCCTHDCYCCCMYNYCVSGCECMTVSTDILSCPLLTQSSLMAQVKLIGNSVYYPSSQSRSNRYG